MDIQKMTKSELIEAIATKQTQLTQKDIDSAVKTILEHMAQSLEKGERIGQLVLNKVEQIEWNPVLALADTNRGSGGFGSTGKK